MHTTKFLAHFQRPVNSRAFQFGNNSAFTHLPRSRRFSTIVDTLSPKTQEIIQETDNKFRAAKLHLREGSVDAANQLFTRVSEAFSTLYGRNTPQYVESVFWRALFALRAKRLKEATELSREATALFQTLPKEEVNISCYLISA